MNIDTKDKFIRFIDRMTPEQEARLERLVDDDDLLTFLAWFQSAKVVGRGIGVFTTLVRKGIMALVYILIPLVVLKWLLSGEITLREVLQWFGR